MASPTKVHKTRKRLKRKQLGRARKNKIERVGSTPAKTEFFGDTKKRD